MQEAQALQFTQFVWNAMNTGSHTPEEVAQEGLSILGPEAVEWMKANYENGQAVIDGMRFHYESWGHPEWYPYFKANISWADQMIGHLKTL